MTKQEAQGQLLAVTKALADGETKNLSTSAIAIAYTTTYGFDAIADFVEAFGGKCFGGRNVCIGCVLSAFDEALAESSGTDVPVHAGTETLQ
jgi:hypothetical protein